MEKTNLPLQLDEGLFFEDEKVLLKWETPISSLSNFLNPEIIIHSVSKHFIWKNKTCLGGLKCEINALQIFEVPNPRAFHIYLDNLHYISLKIKTNKDDLKSSETDFKTIYDKLVKNFGDASFCYPKYSFGLPAIFWEIDKIKFSFAKESANCLVISITHEPVGFIELKNQATEIRQREGEGARVNSVVW